MTHKQVIFTHHAKREMRKAKVKRTEVLFVLWNGVRRITRVTGSTTYWGALAYLPKHKPVEVYFVEYPRIIVVITVFRRGKYD